MNKKFLIVIIVVVVLGAGYAVFRYAGKRQPVQPKPQPGQGQTNNTGQQPAAGKNAKPYVNVVQVPTTQLPKGLPSDLPIEKSATVISNVQFATPDGKTQYTRSYYSSRTLDDNYTVFKNYLDKNGWTINSAVNTEAVKTLDATKGNNRLSITIGKDPANKVTVSVSFVE